MLKAERDTAEQATQPPTLGATRHRPRSSRAPRKYQRPWTPLRMRAHSFTVYLWEQPEEVSPGPLLSLEEQILNSTFEACDPQRTGTVAVTHVLAYLEAVTGQGPQDSRLQTLARSLDPKGEGPGATVDLDTFLVVMRNWIAACQLRGPITETYKALPTSSSHSCGRRPSCLGKPGNAPGPPPGSPPAHKPAGLSLLAGPAHLDSQKLRSQPTWRALEAKTPDPRCTYPQNPPCFSHPSPVFSCLPRPATADLLSSLEDLELSNRRLAGENAKLQRSVETAEEGSARLTEEILALRRQLRRSLYSPLQSEISLWLLSEWIYLCISAFLSSCGSSAPALLSTQQALQFAKAVDEELEDLKSLAKSLEEKNRSLLAQARQTEKEQQYLVAEVETLQEESFTWQPRPAETERGRLMEDLEPGWLEREELACVPWGTRSALGPGPLQNPWFISIIYSELLMAKNGKLLAERDGVRRRSEELATEKDALKVQPLPGARELPTLPGAIFTTTS
ncbi:Hypothetical predicted protein [Marmota monax]|uniref:EF-hand domain-containing protein n=1 Tax=Marmota monax TaxID=9995 RepID=A0A5E4BAV9_MARMO|nr:Hypothetical predicted protein [Marmota monax]